jgi:predicted phosphate transport protein (TIGR00153 family)
MNAFDMISEPILFTQQLREYSGKVHQSVELIQSLADALLAEDHAAIRTLHEQMCGTWHEVNQSRLCLYGQISGMRFHVAGGESFNRYMTCQDQVADSLPGLADLMASRNAAFPTELRDDFKALVAGAVNLCRRTMDLAERLLSEAQDVGADAEAQDSLKALEGTAGERDKARQHEMEFTQRLYGSRNQLDPVTVMFLDKCCTTLRGLADNAQHAADHLRLMNR